MGALGSATNTSRAASRISQSLRAASARRPLRGVGVLPEVVSSSTNTPYHILNGTIRSDTIPKRNETFRYLGNHKERRDGMTASDHKDAEIRPFRIEIPEADLDDLN